MAEPTSHPIGLVVAMEAELVHLLRRVGPVEEAQDGPWLFRAFEVAGQAVVALRCGMGLINAAAGTERLLGYARPRLVLNFGCSGAHRRDVMPGDLVVGERVVHHSAMHVLKDGSELYKGFGYDVAGERMEAAELTADPGLLALATDLALAHHPEPWPADLDWPAGQPRRPPQVHTGPIASADIWTQWVERLDILHARHGTLCEDMEAAAIAQVCALHGVPFLSIKDISNNEYHKSSDIDQFTDFPVAEIGKRAAAFVESLISRLVETG